MTKVVIIGAGMGGSALIEIFHNDPLVQIIGVADINGNAPGIRLAKKLHIPVSRDFKRLLRSKEVNLVIDVTGKPLVETTLHNALPPSMAIIGGPSAKFVWQLIEERIQSKEKIEQHLLEYQSLYRLYVKEVELTIAEERTRIACDIHDGLIQTLVGLNYHIDYCTDQIEKKSDNALTAINDVKRLLKDGIAEAREVVFNLRPMHLDQLGLCEALSNYVKSYEKQYQIKILLNTSGKERKMPSEVKIFVFRMIQEALANVQKHAEASQVKVDVTIEKVCLSASIVDNGIGFRKTELSHQAKKQISFGLDAISERARLLDGKAEITSRLGRGTRVSIRIPLQGQTSLPQRDGG